MKKCPYCGADIFDDAHFCLYCMTSLEEKSAFSTTLIKKKILLFSSLAVVSLLIIIAGIIFLGKAPQSHNNSYHGNIITEYPLITPEISNQLNGSEINIENTTIPNHTSSQETTTNQKPTYMPTTEPTVTSVPTQKPAVKPTATLVPTQKPVVKPTATPMSTQKPVVKPTATPVPTQKPVVKPTVTPAPTQKPFPTPNPEVTYVYRKAESGDDFSMAYRFPENAIVITDVTTPSSTGVYIIPEKIDGNPVVCIMEYAFCNKAVNTTVKKVVVPSCVKTIRDYAFANCINLTDIYFSGNIYTSTAAFPKTERRTGTLNIHCSEDCTDRNFRYYKKSAAMYYDAVYQEWDGTNL